MKTTTNPGSVKALPSTRLPWRVVENEGMFEVWTAKDETPGSRNNYIVADLIQDRQEAEVIAAAPALLAALKVAVRVMQDNNLDESMAGEFEQFTDAINQAEAA